MEETDAAFASVGDADSGAGDGHGGAVRGEVLQRKLGFEAGVTVLDVLEFFDNLLNLHGMLILKAREGRELDVTKPRQILISAENDYDRLQVDVLVEGGVQGCYGPMSRTELATRILRFLDPTCERP